MSKGQEAHLVLILCMARAVPLVILDEPFSGKDGISRKKIKEGLLRQIFYMESSPFIYSYSFFF